ncbi:MAG: DUF1292 domain-containing protein [Clostridia bacterium]|nr:DUF1292 domain-containing protein [Clostridia bacterium]
MEEDNIVQFTDEAGKIYNFYHVGTIDHDGKNYAFFTPADEMEGVDPDEVIIYEVTEDNDLAPVLDQDVLDAVFNAFVEEMDECGCGCGCGDAHAHGHHHHCDCGCEDCGGDEQN